MVAFQISPMRQFLCERMRKMKPEDIARLINVPLEDGQRLSVQTVHQMLSNGSLIKVSPGSFVTRRAENQPKLCIVLSGLVRLTAFTEDGNEMLALMLRPGDIWGVHPCLGGFPETNDAVIEETGEILMLSVDAVEKLMWTCQDFQKSMVGLLCRRLNLAVSVAEQLGAWTARERLAWRLLLLARGIDEREAKHYEPEIAISQESLASMLHLSRQRTNMILKAMEADGLVKLGYGRISIVDAEKLRGEYARAH